MMIQFPPNSQEHPMGVSIGERQVFLATKSGRLWLPDGLHRPHPAARGNWSSADPWCESQSSLIGGLLRGYHGNLSIYIYVYNDHWKMVNSLRIIKWSVENDGKWPKRCLFLDCRWLQLSVVYNHTVDHVWYCHPVNNLYNKVVE